MAAARCCCVGFHVPHMRSIGLSGQHGRRVRHGHVRLVGGDWCRRGLVYAGLSQMVCGEAPLPGITVTMVAAAPRARRRAVLPAGAMLLAACVGLMALLVMPGTVMAQCSNACSGHGTCNSFSTCTCYTGWREGDCSLRTCPSGLPWVAKGSDYTLHVNTTECSNNGLCNRLTGRCKCNEGFTGAACDRRTYMRLAGARAFSSPWTAA